MQPRRSIGDYMRKPTPKQIGEILFKHRDLHANGFGYGPTPDMTPMQIQHALIQSKEYMTLYCDHHYSALIQFFKIMGTQLKMYDTAPRCSGLLALYKAMAKYHKWEVPEVCFGTMVLMAEACRIPVKRREWLDPDCLISVNTTKYKHLHNLMTKMGMFDEPTELMTGKKFNRTQKAEQSSAAYAATGNIRKDEYGE